MPRKFPDEKGILRPNMIPFMCDMFSLVDRIQPHVEGNNEESKIDNNENEDEDDDDDLVF